MREWIETYYSERWGQKLLCGEGGFLVYEIAGPQFYIAEFFVSPDHRKSGRAFHALMEAAKEIALEAGCRMFTAHVPLNMRNTSQVVRANLGYGFKIIGVESRGLAMSKEIF